ncbi:MAG: hypothetical protein IKP86_13615 [Anaerolineaceae bacterium]|nr:hypothetical protein [Anaerolineaceae bacterium]
MKKRFAFLLVFSLLAFAACAQAEEATDRALIDIAQEMADESAKMFSQEFIIQLFSASTEFNRIILDAAEAWNASLCSRAAVLTLDKPVLESAVAQVAAASGYDVTEEAVILLVRNHFASIPSLINGLESNTDWLVASGLMTLTDVRSLAGYPAEYAYILLDSGREDGLAALVSVIIKEDGAASIISSFIKAPQFLDTVFSLEGQDLVTVLSKMLADEGIFLPPVDTTIPEGIHFAVYRFSL